MLPLVQLAVIIACASAWPLLHEESKGLSSRSKPLPKFKNIFTFGDSYTATHFDYTGTLPNAPNPLGNPAFPGVTTSNGDNWIGFLISQYNKSLVLDYDFAVAGATIDNNLVPAYESTVPSYDQQVSHLLTLTNKTEWKSENTLFTVWFGINDISRGYNANTWSKFSQVLIDRYFNISQTLYDNGARNFLFMSVPPIQRTPELLAENATAQATTAYTVSSYNQLLNQGANRFTKHNKDINAILFDTTPSFDVALNNPTAYGAPDAICYSGDGVSCLWWNDFHPGQAIHKLVAGAVANVTGI